MFKRALGIGTCSFFLKALGLESLLSTIKMKIEDCGNGAEF